MQDVFILGEPHQHSCSIMTPVSPQQGQGHTSRTTGLVSWSGPAPLPLGSFTRIALAAKLPKVNANLPATGALVYSFLQGKISCWQKHF